MPKWGLAKILRCTWQMHLMILFSTPPPDHWSVENTHFLLEKCFALTYSWKSEVGHGKLKSGKQYKTVFSLHPIATGHSSVLPPEATCGKPCFPGFTTDCVLTFSKVRLLKTFREAETRLWLSACAVMSCLPLTVAKLPFPYTARLVFATWFSKIRQYVIEGYIHR